MSDVDSPLPYSVNLLDYYSSFVIHDPFLVKETLRQDEGVVKAYLGELLKEESAYEK